MAVVVIAAYGCMPFASQSYPVLSLQLEQPLRPIQLALAVEDFLQVVVQLQLQLGNIGKLQLVLAATVLGPHYQILPLLELIQARLAPPLDKRT